MPTRLGSLSIETIYLGDIKIGKAYLNGQVVFDGEQWVWCLAGWDSELQDWSWLETKDDYKLQPKLEG